MLEFGGKKYESFAALCRAYGKSDSQVRRREGLGWTRHEALGITERESKSKYNAKKFNLIIEDPHLGELEFDSIKAASRHYKLDYDLVIQRLKKHGWTAEQSLGLDHKPVRKSHNGLKIEVEGLTFDSRSDCALYFNVDQRLVFSRLRRDWSLKEALGIIPRTPNVLTPTQEAYVYQIQDLLSLKLYVGVTVNSIEDRFAQHNYSSTSRSKKGSLQAAIYEDGSENFELKLLEVTELQYLSSKEKHWISVKSSASPRGYNLTSGGAGIGRRYKSEATLDEKRYSSTSDIARSKGIKPATLQARLRTMTLEEALSKPFRKSPRS